MIKIKQAQMRRNFKVIFFSVCAILVTQTILVILDKFYLKDNEIVRSIVEFMQFVLIFYQIAVFLLLITLGHTMIKHLSFEIKDEEDGYKRSNESVNFEPDFDLRRS